jgi:hypothetical protein
LRLVRGKGVRPAGALALAAAVVLAGCGGDDAADPKDGSSTPAPAAEGASTPEPAGGLSGSEADDEVVEVDESDQGDEANDPIDESDQGDEANDPIDESDQGDEANDPIEGSGGLSPGDPCSLEEGSPDCIDPDGDGEGVYLLGGADCVASAPDVASCEDLDGDGYAGYPDSEGS